MTVLCILLLAIGISAHNDSEVTTSRPGIVDGVKYIAEGYSIYFREAPWHAGIYRKTTKPYMQICGGTVVAKHAVITAAHCFVQDRTRPDVSQFAVAAGKIYRPWNDPQDIKAQKSDVKEIMIPPHYQGSVANFQDDIAVVTLVTEFVYDTYVTPACISFNADFDAAQLQHGQLGRVVGWGLTGENSRASQVLQGATLPTVAIDKCIEQSPVSFKSSITGDKFCAGYSNGTALCRGDSGGGLVFRASVNNDHNQPFLRGVVSTSPATANLCNVFTWATFTHLLRHEHFLESYLPGIELSCVNSTEPQVEFRFGQTGLEHRLNDRECTCVCPNRY